MADMFPNAVAYEKLMGRWSEKLAPLFLDFAGVRDGNRILDVGCGTGALVDSVARRASGSSIVGIVPSRPFVVAKSNQKKIVTLTTRLSCLSTPSPFNAFHFQAISKTALNRAMRTLRLELRQTGIIVALISPGRTDTDGLAASKAAIAASLGDSAPPANQPVALSVEQSVAAMVRVIASLDGSYDGSHLDFQGNVIPW
jgi:NAD(P)-dependent dehydrogenase (short-subunit alcohol dehydrogenase family)